MLNLKNTLDGYLKNVEVIGNTIQDTNNLANIRSVGDKVEGQELYKIDVVSRGKNLYNPNKAIIGNITETGEFQSVNNQILSDFIEVRPNTYYIHSLQSSNYVVNGFIGYDANKKFIKFLPTSGGITDENIKFVRLRFRKNDSTPIAIEDVYIAKPQLEEGRIITPYEPYKGEKLEILSPVQLEKVGNVVDRIVCKDGVWGVDKKVNAEVKNNVLVNTRTNSEFIPLPHDQQVKLRTFAGQTNIAFLTEIAGQIKAQVPKSLGATVNTHTEQIKDLHNSLERVKKLEETTVSTIETENNFTTVDATNNGYFEGVKLEGKTLVNLVDSYSLVSDNIWAKSSRETITNITVINNSNKAVYLDTSRMDGSYHNSKLINANSVVYHEFSPNTKFRLLNGASSLGWLTSEIDYFKESCFVLEGDHTQNTPSYFEGLMSVGQDVEEVSVASMNENLWSNGRITISTDNIIPKNANAYVYLKRGDYLLSCNYTNDSDSSTSFRFSVKRNNSTGEVISGLKGMNNTFTINDDGIYYIAIDRTSGFNGKITSGDICLVLSSNFTQHIPHQSNKKPLLYYNPTTETWEKPILREFDTIEKHSDGKYYYHKRSGELVLNGSENWRVNPQIATEDCMAFYCTISDALKGVSMYVPIISDRFNTLTQNSISFSDWREGCVYHGWSFGVNILINKTKLSTQDVEGFKAWLKANPTTVVYQLAQEEVYECTNIDLMTYSGETNYIINSGAISPKSLLKVHNNISNVVKILQEKVSLLENVFISGLKSVLSGDMYSLATILYPEDFEQNDNTEQDIMVIPE